MGLKTGIWASRPEFGPRDWDLRGGTEEKKKKKKEKEKIPHICESIGHRPLRGPCPKRRRNNRGTDGEKISDRHGRDIRGRELWKQNLKVVIGMEVRSYLGLRSMVTLLLTSSKVGHERQMREWREHIKHGSMSHLQKLRGRCSGKH